MISPRNFGSQTRSAVCFDVTGSVAPRSEREFVHPHAPPLAAVHHVEPPRVIAARAAATPLRFADLSDTHALFLLPRVHDTLVGAPRAIQSFHVGRQKAPASHAEPLAPKLAARVRAAHALFVAADELGDLEDCHQAVRQLPCVDGTSTVTREFSRVCEESACVCFMAPPCECDVWSEAPRAECGAEAFAMAGAVVGGCARNRG